MRDVSKTAAWTVGLLVFAAQALAAPALKSPSGLQAVPAMVISVDHANHTVVLRVRSTGRDARTFQLSRACQFSGGLLSEANLFNNERVLIWTEVGLSDGLPVIYRIDREQN